MSNKKRKVIFPEYISEFQCIGSSCEDTCCAGWRIIVDKETFTKYKNVKDPNMKSMLKENIKRNRSNTTESSYAKINMDNEGYCKFLDEERLCMIHKELGPELLSNTCSVYPRNIQRVTGVIEKSATLSCPEVSRLVLLNEKGIEFTQELESSESRGLVQNIEMNKQQEKMFWELRIFIIQVLQTRILSIEDRLIIIGLFLKRYEKLTTSDIEDNLHSIINEFTASISDGSLQESIKQLPKNIAFQINMCKSLIEYRSTSSIGSQRYLDCLNNMINGLGMDKEISDDEVIKNYKEAYTVLYKPFMDKHEYIFENYLVNYVFSKIFPFDKKTVTDSYCMLIINFSMIKLHLIGMAKYNDEINQDLIIKLVQSYTKVVDHNIEYLTNVEEMISESGYKTLAHMVVLVRN